MSINVYNLWTMIVSGIKACLFAVSESSKNSIKPRLFTVPPIILFGNVFSPCFVIHYLALV